MKSEKLNELAVALIKAQSEMNPVMKDASNPFFKSRYATLTAVCEATLPALHKNNLCILQTVETDHLVTILLHTSGQFVESHYPLNPVKNDPQGLGACLTYARRYALMAIVSLPAEDDDGEVAHGRGNVKANLQMVPEAPAVQIPNTKPAPTYRNAGPGVIPEHCGKPMYISKYPEEMAIELRPYYCGTCKAKVAR